MLLYKETRKREPFVENMPTQLVHGSAHGIGRTSLRRVEGLALCARKGQEREHSTGFPHRIEECSRMKVVSRITRRHHQSRCPSRPCGPSCVDAGLRQRRSAARSLRHHTRMLEKKDVRMNFE